MLSGQHCDGPPPLRCLLPGDHVLRPGAALPPGECARGAGGHAGVAAAEPRGDRQRPGLRERRGQRAQSTGGGAQAPAQADQQQNHSHAAALRPRQAGLLSTKTGSECKEINIKFLVIKFNLIQTLCLPLDFYRTINQAPPILQTLFWTDLASWVCSIMMMMIKDNGIRS